MWVRMSPASTSEVHPLEKTLTKGKNLQRLTLDSRIPRLHRGREAHSGLLMSGETWWKRANSSDLETLEN